MPPQSPSPHVLRSMLRRHRGLLMRVAVPAVVAEFVELAVSVELGLVIDHGVVAENLTVTLLGAAAIVTMRVVGVSCWSYAFLRLLWAQMVERHRLRMAVTAAVLDPRSRPADRPAGEVLSIATSDADQASDLFDLAHWAVPVALAVVASAIWFVVLDPWLGLALVVGVVSMMTVFRGVTPALSQRYDAQQSEAAEAAATATDLVQGLRILQGLGVQAEARTRYRARSRTALRAALVNARYSGVSFGLTTAVTTVMLAAVVLIASFHTLAGDMTLGTLIAVVGVARSVMGLLQALASVPVNLATISTSGRRVAGLLADLGWSVDDPELAIDDASPPTAPLGRRGASGGLRITGDIDLEVADGSVVALACAHSRDAQAVADLLAGHGTGGRAHLGTERITPETRWAVRADLLVEPHHVDLFDGSLRDQLATGRTATDPGDAWAERALDAAGARDLLRILPDGLDSPVADRGANLSGGQRQRIALARAVAADVPVLVLQEPTTAVDAVTEQHIAAALVGARRAPDRATLLITRAPALLAAADRVVYVDSGRVVATGTHAELMHRDDYAGAVAR